MANDIPLIRAFEGLDLHSNHSDAAQLVGAPFPEDAFDGANLRDALRTRVSALSGGAFTEADEAGRSGTVTLREMEQSALNILAALQRVAGPETGDVVLAFDQARAFVPAAWACVFGGYSCLPWQMRKAVQTSKALDEKLAHVIPALARPVLVTTKAIQQTLGPTRCALFSKVICVDALTAENAVVDRSTGAQMGRFLIPTSGTTSTPKIAILTHQTLLNRFAAHQISHANQRALNYAPFDSVAGLSILFPCGSENLYLHPDRFVTHPLTFLQLLERHKVETFSMSSSSAARLQDAAVAGDQTFDLTALRHIRFGAEMILPKIVATLMQTLETFGANQVETSFGYSMTEASFVTWTGRKDITALTAASDDVEKSVSLGACGPGWRLRIVDENRQPLAAGQVGQIEVTSQYNLFDGYLGDPVRSAQALRPDGWYATGDRGMIDEGALKITGRKASTIIVNSRNIALEQIEGPLRHLQGVQKGLLFAAPVRTKDSSTDELALFFSPRSQDRDALDPLCRDMTRQTAQNVGVAVKHLVVVPADEMPLTATGKVRRDDLISRYQNGDLAAYQIGTPRAGPMQTNRTVNWLAGLWRGILDLHSTPTAQDNFFDLGADSMAAARLIQAVEEKFNCVLPLDDFFAVPTIAALARLIMDAQSSPRAPSAYEMGPDTSDVFRKLEAFVGGWEGTRAFPAA